MPAPLAVDWTEAKTLALALGSADQAADQLGISRVATRQRASRQNWFAKRNQARAALAKPKAQLLQEAFGPKAVSQRPVTAAEVLADLPRQNKALSNALANRALAKLSEKDDEELVTGVTTTVATEWIRNAERAGGWAGDSRGPGVTLSFSLHTGMVMPQLDSTGPVVDV